MSSERAEEMTDVNGTVEMAEEASDIPQKSKLLLARSGPKGLPQTRQDAQFQVWT